MKGTKIAMSAVVSGVLGASLMTGTALAWHPKGVINKSVQNQSNGTALSDAESASTAVEAKTGDTLVYTITVSNIATQASDGDNDMYYTKLTDTLPAGVELANNPSQRTISEDLGVIKPGAKVTREYTVRVTGTADGQIIENKACFTGDSKVKDNHQEGCNVAVVKVHTPEAPVTPTQPTPTELPHTGTATTLAFLTAGVISALAYGLRVISLRRRAS